jgi:hypothetical protein
LGSQEDTPWNGGTRPGGGGTGSLRGEEGARVEWERLKIFPIIFIEQITILPLVKNRKKPDNTTVLPFGRIVRCKNPLHLLIS